MEGEITETQNGAAHALIEMESTTESNTGSTMSFHDLEYKVFVRERCGVCQTIQEKIILRSVSGILGPGLNAIMGSTGSGKTTMLDALAGRKDPIGLSGEVFLDGKPIPQNFQYLSGYVVQNDLFIGTMTVRESLWFCANMRLPASITHNEKKQRIQQVLGELGLNSCADTRIGTNNIRGISGGEKKRTSIALEMILHPRILFLDEPTTGLDASTAISVMDLLKKLATQGKTIVCSIHQPRYSIFNLFDSLTLLSNGTLVYQGAADQVLGHFENLGYMCQPHDNPADFILDVLNGRHEPDMINDDHWRDTSLGTVPQDELGLTEKLRTCYAESSIYRVTERELAKLGDIKSSKAQVQSGKMYATGTFHQLRVLLGRTFLNIVRDPAALIGNVVLNIIIGVVFGILYFQVNDSEGSGTQNRSGILFFICTSLLFGSISVINAFTAERNIFVHEHVSGYYRVASYFFAKVLADLIPLRTIAPIIFGTITYWMVGLKPEFEAFIIFLLTCILLGYSSVGIGLFYSASFQQAVAQLMLVLTFVFTIIFSGLLVNVGKMFAWVSWLEYLSVARYALVGLSVNEFRDRTFLSCPNSNSFSADAGSSSAKNTTACTVIKGEEYLHRILSVGDSAAGIGEWDLWVNHVALACICFGLYTMTYVQLLRIKKFS